MLNKLILVWDEAGVKANEIDFKEWLNSIAKILDKTYDDHLVAIGDIDIFDLIIDAVYDNEFLARPVEVIINGVMVERFMGITA